MCGEARVESDRYKPEGLNDLLELALPEYAMQVAGVSLSRQKHSRPERADWSTVYTLVEGECPIILAMHASNDLMLRAANNILECEDVGQEDIEECATEFFNVLCGRVIARLYQRLGSSVMLYPPRVVTERYFPAVDQMRYGGVLRFDTDNLEEVELQWVSPEEGLPPEELMMFRRGKS